MSDFITNGASELPSVKSDARPATGGTTEWAADDANKVRQALLDTRGSLLSLVQEATSGLNINDPSSAEILATGSTEPRSLAARFADSVNILDFGADPTGSADSTNAIQAAIDLAVSDYKSVLIPDGTYLVSSSLDLADGKNYLCIWGTGHSSKILASTSGYPVFDCTGTLALTFKNFRVQGNQTNAPSAGFLFSRATGNGSAGLHRIEGLNVDGYFTKTCVASLSSEANVYTDCLFRNYQSAAGCVSIETDNSFLSMTTSCSTFPAPFSGGNTVHKFVNCIFDNQGNHADAYCLRFGSGTLDAAVTNCFINCTSTGKAGIWCAGTMISLKVIGTSGETNGATYAILLDGNTSFSTFDCHFYGQLYAANSTTVASCQIPGKFIATPGVSVYDMTDSFSDVVQGVTVRNSSIGNRFWGGGQQKTSVSLPATVGGNEQTWLYTGGDLVTRYYNQICDDSKSRLVSHIIKANHQMRTQAPAYATPYSPVTDSGCVIAMTLTGNISITNPTTGNYNSGVTNEGDGLVITLILKQDGSGGHTISFSSNYITNFTATTTASTTSVISFIYSSTIGKWVQLYSATGLA